MDNQLHKNKQTFAQQIKVILNSDKVSSLNFNNKQTVMLRRKNNDLPYGQTHTNQSPYRFERKNPNLSPGLSPMRCRTPTRGNISPFRVAANNDNFRAHSPIKFVSSKINNPASKGFFRTQNHLNHPTQFNQKYATSTTNNDHSIRRQSYYENPNNSKIYAPYENSQRTMLHENTKLFSKLVQKLNSEKKKEPQLVRRNTKPQLYKAQQIAQIQQKPMGIEKLTRQKSQTQNQKIQPIVQHIKAVQSVVYEQKQTKTYFHQQSTYNYGKQNKDYYHENTKKFKQNVEKIQTVALQVAKNNNLKVQRMEEKPQSQHRVQQKVERPTTPSKQEEAPQQKLKSGKKQAEKYQTSQNYQFQENNNKPTDIQKANNNKMDESTCFEDIEMYLSKLKSGPNDYKIYQDESFSNNSDTNNMSMSLNMDPCI